MSRPTISVALCTYNGEKYLREQLDSIANQTRQPDELVVGDDGSTDSTVNIIHDFAGSTPFPVRLFINEKRLGSSGNFGRTIGLCQGDIIALSDQDDVWEKDKLAAFESVFVTHPGTDALFSDAEIVDQALRPMGYRLWDALKFSTKERREVEDGKAIRTLLRHNVVTGAAMAFRSRLRPIFLPVPDNVVHDAWIALLVAATGRLRLIPQRLILYRQHGGNQIGVARLDFFERIQRPYDRMIREAQTALRHYELAIERLRDGHIKSVAPSILDGFTQNIAHKQRRIAVALRKPGWFAIMFAEIVHGRYHRYSVGWWSIAHDLVKCSLSRP